MSEFDAHAREWDNNQIHIDRSIAIAGELEKKLPADSTLKALEYGAGTGLLSFQLKDKFSQIVLMDNSKEMIKVCEEKVEYYHTRHIKPVWFDLEHYDFEAKFDIIYSQMVLHHVNNVELILDKFQSMLNPKGILAIADLYTEDGSFHGPDVNVHLGFDPEFLNEKLKKKRFMNSEFKTCFLIKRPSGIDYPVFLLTATRI
jgi:2-polyprenyl-3-methyl-5-hydroxy-6-metoxy-1,4-benzoquinol methylase